eukprot:627869-Amphidinium_carterae.1
MVFLRSFWDFWRWGKAFAWNSLSRASHICAPQKTPQVDFDEYQPSHQQPHYPIATRANTIKDQSPICCDT